MTLENDVQNILGARPLGQVKEPSVRQHTTRLDNTGTKEPPQRGYSRKKFIRSGGMIEIYDYQYPIHFGKRGKKIIKKERKKSKRTEEHRGRTIIRAINNLRRLVHLNFTCNDKFVTLTFNNDQSFDINNLKESLVYLQKFLRKLRRKYPNLKYVVVPEFQKRGAVHYHILCNLPLIRQKEMENLWPYGFSKVLEIIGTTHLSFYLTKYLGKKFKDKRKQGHRLFYSSRGLKRPVVLYGHIVDDIDKDLKMNHSDAVQYKNNWKGKHCGNVSYTQYVRDEE